MKKNGFKRFNAVLNITTVNCVGLKEDVSEPVKSVDDVILDSIFSRDQYGWPRTSLAAMLSDKTSDDVRKYIQDHILVAKEVNHLITDDKIIAGFKELDSEFIAETSPNKFETSDQYESRIADYISRMQSKEASEKRLNSWKSFMEKYNKKDDEGK